MKVLHVISGLETGGAELFLERLLRTLDTSEFESAVISLGEIGPVGRRLQHRGIAVHALGAGFSPTGIAAILKIRQVTCRFAPDLIQGWLYHGNLGASLARRVAGLRCPVVWNVRHCLDGWRQETIGLRAVIRLGGQLSGSAGKIIFNSAAAARQHERCGYPASKALVIPNGVDCQIFRPDEPARNSMRGSFGFADDTVVVGIVGRNHPVKDHETFLRASRGLVAQVPSVRIMLIGRDMTTANRPLARLIDELELVRHVLLLGERGDIPALMNAMDVHVSSSWAESFPNTVIEAMACGVPCVVTDVGASREIVAECGRVVPSHSPEALTVGLADLVHAGRQQRRRLGAAARERVQRHYELGSVIARYADFYRALLAGSRRSEPVP